MNPARCVGTQRQPGTPGGTEGENFHQKRRNGGHRRQIFLPCRQTSRPIRGGFFLRFYFFIFKKSNPHIFCHSF